MAPPRDAIKEGRGGGHLPAFLSNLLLVSELSHVRVQLRFQIRTYIYMCVWPYVKLYAHAWWYVMWEELSVDHFLKHSNHLKQPLKMF